MKDEFEFEFDGDELSTSLARKNFGKEKLAQLERNEQCLLFFYESISISLLINWGKRVSRPFL